MADEWKEARVYRVTEGKSKGFATWTPLHGGAETFRVMVPGNCEVRPLAVSPYASGEMSWFLFCASMMFPHGKPYTYSQAYAAGLVREVAE